MECGVAGNGTGAVRTAEMTVLHAVHQCNHSIPCLATQPSLNRCRPLAACKWSNIARFGKTDDRQDRLSAVGNWNPSSSGQHERRSVLTLERSLHGMAQSEIPASSLVHGLQRLVADVTRNTKSETAGLGQTVCSTTSLLGFHANGVHYCGRPVSQLIQSHRFEEVAALLLSQDSFTDDQIADWSSVLQEPPAADLPPEELFGLFPAGARPVDLLPLCINLIRLFDSDPAGTASEERMRSVQRLLALLPDMLHQALEGGRSRSPNTRPSAETWTCKLLSVLRGGEQSFSQAEEHAVNALFIAQCLPQMRAACFVARVAASSPVAAMHSASTVFCSQLMNDPFQWCAELFLQLESPHEADLWWQARKGRPVPFGFTSTVPDNRVRLIADICRTLLGSPDRIRVAAAAARLERFESRQHRLPTLDWVSALLMTLLGIPPDRQGLTIGIARLAGWAAQAAEQNKSGVELLPVLRYAEIEEAE